VSIAVEGKLDVGWVVETTRDREQTSTLSHNLVLVEFASLGSSLYELFAQFIILGDGFAELRLHVSTCVMLGCGLHLGDLKSWCGGLFIVDRNG